MASDYVDDFLRDERESFKRKETAAKKFDNRLDNFRKSAQALRDAARQFEEAFPGMSRTMIADKLAMTGTEKSVAFDAKGELVAAPAGRKTVSAEPTVAPAADAEANTAARIGRSSRSSSKSVAVRTWAGDSGGTAEVVSESFSVFEVSGRVDSFMAVPLLEGMDSPSSGEDDEGSLLRGTARLHSACRAGAARDVQIFRASPRFFDAEASLAPSRFQERPP